MASEKTNTDDYYASLKTQNSGSDDKKPTAAKKVKIKAKKKVVKKKEETTTPVADETVVTPSETKEEKVASVSGQGPAIVFKEAPKEEVKKEEATIQTRGSKKKEEKVFKPGRKKEEPKTFKKKEEPKKKYKSAKKSNLKYKGKFDAISDNFDGFKRGKNIAAQKKKEKSAEDIKQNLTDRKGQEVQIPDFVTVKELSDKIGVPIAKVITELLKNGVMVNLNTQIDFDTAFLIGEAFEIIIKRKEHSDVSVHDILDGNIEEITKNDNPDEMIERAPIVSIMGHVDHGKTSILDYIRKSSVASGEAGGITQSIGSYQVNKNDKDITFLDTPGHEAFMVMRARGAKLTDIAIIVVAADEGMKPQTIESINLAKEAGVPIIVAINKMDKEGANPDFIKGQLSEQGLQPEDWGGETICVPCSALTGEGIDQLLDMILLVAEMNNWKAHPTRPGVGTVIESHVDSGQGVVATILINAGEFKKGDAIVVGGSHGRIRMMKDYRNKNTAKAGTGMPILISGLNEVVEGGDIAQIVKDTEAARERAQEFKKISSSKSIKQFEGASLLSLMNKMQSGSLKQLKVVVKADTNGSLEALKASLLKIESEDVEIKIIHAGVGSINESDVLMAGTSTALLVGFNVSTLAAAQDTLNKSKIELISDKVIYRILEKVESIATGMIDIKYEEIYLGTANVKAIFYTAKKMMITGLEVKEGKIENKAKIRVIKNDRTVGSGVVENLKKGVENVHEVQEGEECGIQFEGDMQLQEGDVLEFFKTQERK